MHRAANNMNSYIKKYEFISPHMNSLYPILVWYEKDGH